jgi:hypothetical protein
MGEDSRVPPLSRRVPGAAGGPRPAARIVPPVLPESLLLAARAALSAEPAQEEEQDPAEPAKAPQGQAAQTVDQAAQAKAARRGAAQPGAARVNAGQDRAAQNSAGPDQAGSGQAGSDKPGAGQTAQGRDQQPSPSADRSAGLPRRVPGANDGPKAPARVTPPALPTNLLGRVSEIDDTQPIPAVPRSAVNYLPSPVVAEPAAPPGRAKKPDRAGWLERNRGKPDRASRADRADKPEAAGQPDRAGQPDPAAQPDRDPDRSGSGRVDLGAQAGLGTKPLPVSQPDRASRPDRNGRPGRADPPEPDRNGRPGRAGSPEPDRNGRPGRAGSPENAGPADRPAPLTRAKPADRGAPAHRASPAGRATERKAAGDPRTAAKAAHSSPSRAAAPRSAAIQRSSAAPLRADRSPVPVRPSRQVTEPSAAQGRRRYRMIGMVLSVMVLLTAGSVTFAVYKLTQTPGSPDSGAVSAKTLATEQVARKAAAAWIFDQVSRSAVVSCDPAMCHALEADQVPSGDLIELGPAAQYPLGAALVVVTAAVRGQFGSSLASGYAPDVLASFGSGAARVEVRVMSAKGASAYTAALKADIAARKTFAPSLLHISTRITYTSTARKQLAAGQVDARLMIAIADLASLQPVVVEAFGDSGPGASPGMPLRSADLAETSGMTPTKSSAYIRSVVKLLSQQTGAYRAAKVSLVHTGTRTVLRVEFAAPGPLGLLNGSPGA